MRRDPSAWVYREYQIACDTPEDSRMPPTATVEGILKGSNTFISSVAHATSARHATRRPCSLPRHQHQHLGSPPRLAR